MTTDGTYLYATDHWQYDPQDRSGTGAVTTSRRAELLRIDRRHRHVRRFPPHGHNHRGRRPVVCDTGNQTIRKIEIDSGRFQPSPAWPG
jgi:hypothetical protein